MSKTDLQIEIEGVVAEFEGGYITEAQRDEAIDAIANRGRASVRASIDSNAA